MLSHINVQILKEMLLELHILFWKLGILDSNIEAALVHFLKFYRSSKLFGIIIWC
jgi:hypothetical protein